VKYNEVLLVLGLHAEQFFSSSVDQTQDKHLNLTSPIPSAQLFHSQTHTQPSYNDSFLPNIFTTTREVCFFHHDHPPEQRSAQHITNTCNTYIRNDAFLFGTFPVMVSGVRFFLTSTKFLCNF
jgi:hypothetical protein